MTDTRNPTGRYPPLDDQLPVVLPSGLTFRRAQFACEFCGVTIPMADMRGRVIWPIETTVEIHGAGDCCQCGHLNEFGWRIYNDATVMSYTSDGWEFLSAPKNPVHKWWLWLVWRALPRLKRRLLYRQH